MDWQFLVLLVVNGLLTGSVYALVAIGFVVIYKSSGVVNFAQGEFLLIGAYLSMAIVSQFNVPFIVAALITMAFSVVLGLVIERLVLRPMIGEPVIAMIMVTLGLSMILRAIVQGIWGTDTQPFPSVFPTEPVVIGSLRIAQSDLWSAASVTLLLILFSLFFKFSRAGIAMRATAFSQQVALSMGISVKVMFALAWAIAAVVAGVGGMLVGASRGGVDGSLALMALKVLPVVILGGLDSILGAIIGGLLIGVLENLTGGYLDQFFYSSVKEVIPFVILVLILMVKPYGLFGKVKIERV